MRNVIFLGLVSFFADISAEMVYPLIPLYLVSAFGATPALVGIIEGIAESLASLLKVGSGYVTDKYQHKKPIAFAGYATGLIYKVALLLAASWTGILLARVIDRVGKGIRTAPRDVMISQSADESQGGFAFGIHKAMDMAGSAIGIFLAWLILSRGGDLFGSSTLSAGEGTFGYQTVFLLSMIPAVLGLAMFALIRERREERAVSKREPFWQNYKALDQQLKLYLLVAFLFTLGNSSNAFLLLRASSVGFDEITVILLYFLYNVTASLLSIPAGKRSDRVGRKQLLVAGYLVFSVVYLGFALAWNKPFLIAMFALYGVYTAMIAGVERAFIAEISPRHLKGTMLGLHATLVGIALLPASVIAGGLWTLLGPQAPFLFGASLSLAAALILQLFLKK